MFAFAFSASCTVPPRGIQDRDYTKLDDLRNASDRIVVGVLVSERLETVQQLEIGTKTFVYRTYRVESSFKGSAEPEDELHVVFPSELQLLFGDTMETFRFVEGDTHLLFLKGRARGRDFPPHYGGTLWTLNGEPALALMGRRGGVRFVATARYLENMEEGTVDFSADWELATADGH